MGLPDTVTKAYMRENTVFADAFNYFLYGGRQVIKPERLRELDATELAILPEDAIQRYRDVLKAAVIMQDDESAYVLLGIENQTDIHYAMPVRNLIYDALQYGRQVADIAARHKADKNKGNGRKRAEYLSGFYREDKLQPVITLVVHFGTEKWDGPLSLHEMMAIKDERLLRFVQDYKIHLIDPAGLTPDELNQFSTSLREVMGFIKYSGDKDGLEKFVYNNSHKCMEASAAQVIRAITNTPIEIPEKTEVVDMCKAIEEMINDGREEGKLEGILEGKLEMLADLVQDGILSIQDAAARVNMTEHDFEEGIRKFSITNA